MFAWFLANKKMNLYGFLGDLIKPLVLRVAFFVLDVEKGLVTLHPPSDCTVFVADVV